MGLVRIMSLSPVSMDLRTRRPAGWQAKNWQMRPAEKGMAGKEERGLSFDCEQSSVGFSCFQDDEVVRVVYGCSQDR